MIKDKFTITTNESGVTIWLNGHWVLDASCINSFSDRMKYNQIEIKLGDEFKYNKKNHSLVNK